MKDFYVFVAAGVLLTAASAFGVGALRYRAIPMPLPAVEADADVEIRSISNSGSMVAVISNYRTNAALRGAYWSAPTATPSVLSESGYDIEPVSVNRNGLSLIYRSQRVAPYGPSVQTWTGSGSATLLPTYNGTGTPFNATLPGEINDAGHAALTMSDGTNSIAAVWRGGQDFTLLGDLPGGSLSSGGNAINRFDTVVGNGNTADGQRGFRWTGATGMVELPSLPANTRTTVFGLNDSNVAVGSTLTGTFPNYSGRALRWSPSGGVTDLGAPVSEEGLLLTIHRAFRIANDGTILGSSLTPNLVEGRAVIWPRGGSATLLSNLVDLPSGYSHPWANAINDRGQIGGSMRFDPDNNPATNNSMSVPTLFEPIRRAGDTNYDGYVDFTDLLTLAQNYGRSAGVFWTEGEFDFDGVIGFSDLLALAQAYNRPASFESDWALATSVIPEPSALSALGVFATMKRRRPRRD